METASPGILFTLFAFITGFSILVFVHEWGHYIVGRIFGVRVEVFSIGFGKEIFGWTDKKTGTRWKISMIPLGGYVKFFGDASEASNPGEHVEDLTEEEKSVCLHYKPIWQRALIVAAGPFVNLLLPVLVFASFAFMVGGTYLESNELAEVVPETAAAQAGLKAGDVLQTIDGSKIDRFTELRQEILINVGTPITLGILRDGQPMTINVTPNRNVQQDRFGNTYVTGYLGVRPARGDYVEFGVWGSLKEGYFQTVLKIEGMLTNIGQLLLGMRSIEEMKGPVGMAQIVGEAASLGFLQWLNIITLISISLGIMNLMPIPVLDGGHLVYYALEAIKGGPVNKFAQEVGYVAGLALVLVLMVIVTLNDLQSLAS